MHSSIHYILAIAIACLIVGLGFAIARYWSSTAVREMRERAKQEARSDKFPPELKGVDWDTAPLNDFNFELDAAARFKLQFAMILCNLWFVWVPIVFAVCVGTARLVKRSG